MGPPQGLTVGSAHGTGLDWWWGGRGGQVEAEKVPEVAERYGLKAVPYFVFLMVQLMSCPASCHSFPTDSLPAPWERTGRAREGDGGRSQPA